MIDIKYYKEAAERVSYDPDTGIFTWKKHRSKSKMGTSAGGYDNKGYLRVPIKIDGKECKVKLHRLAWYITYGDIPDTIDHINHEPADNRIENLRNCSHADNIRNMKPRGGTSKFKGVSRHKGKWRAQIKACGKKKHLGRFTDEEEAAKAYNEAAIKYYGEFAYLNKFPIDNNLK